jgi:hypothetical protein
MSESFHLNFSFSGQLVFHQKILEIFFLCKHMINSFPYYGLTRPPGIMVFTNLILYFVSLKHVISLLITPKCHAIFLETDNRDDWFGKSYYHILEKLMVLDIFRVKKKRKSVHVCINTSGACAPFQY